MHRGGNVGAAGAQHTEGEEALVTDRHVVAMCVGTRVEPVTGRGPCGEAQVVEAQPLLPGCGGAGHGGGGWQSATESVTATAAATASSRTQRQ